MKKEYLLCGRIIGTHGTSGGVKMEYYADSAESLLPLERMYFGSGSGGFTEYRIREILKNNAHMIVYFEGINDIDEASRLKWKDVYANRNDISLEEGGYFLEDLKGLKVKDRASGEIYGTVDDVLTNTAQMLISVRRPEGGTFLIPYVDAFVKDVSFDDDGGVMSVELIDGFLD